MAALRASATATPQLFPGLYGFDLYEGLLSRLSAVPPKVRPVVESSLMLVMW